MKLIIWGLCLVTCLGYTSQPVFDSIFPSRYYIGTYLGLPDKPDSFIYPSIPELNQQSIYLYGWVNPTYNRSSAQQNNLPTGFMIVSNQLELDQATVVIEKPLNTLQNQVMDIGFKVTNLAGLDYRYTTMGGVFSQQLYGQNNLYGYDIPEFYVNAFLPGIFKGSIVTLGRYLAPGDIESPLATQNFLSSHSINFIESAFTQFGLTIDTILDDEWSVFLAIHSGSDMAPWYNEAVPTFQMFLKWVSTSQNDSLWMGVNSLNNGQYQSHHDNLQQMNLIWTHRFTPSFFILSEIYYEYQYNARLGSNCIWGPVESYGGGLGCGPIIPGLSDSLAIQNYIEYQFSDKDYTSFRTDFFNDYQGQRTGYPTPYFSLTWGLTHLLGNYIKIRPELRYNWASNATPFNQGTQKTLAIAVLDIIVQT